MNEIPTYNHSNPDSEEEFKPSFYHYAAQISFWAPVLGAAFLKSVEYGINGMKGAWVALGVLATVGIAGVLFLASIVLGVVALFGISKYGTDRILWRSLRGIGVSTVLLCFVSVVFVHDYQKVVQNRKALVEAQKALEEKQRQSKLEATARASAPPASAGTDQNKSKTAAAKATKEATGDMALITKASGAFQTREQAVEHDYNVAAAMLKTPYVLDMNGVERRELLHARKDVVNYFMESNEKLMAFVTKAEKTYRDELERVKLPFAAVDAAMKEYRQSASERNFLTVKIRETDQRIGTAMLGMLNVLDSSWGGWKYNQDKKNVVFQNPQALEQYNSYFNQMKAAAGEQAQLQGKLVNLPATASLN